MPSDSTHTPAKAPVGFGQTPTPPENTWASPELKAAFKQAARDCPKYVPTGITGLYGRPSQVHMAGLRRTEMIERFDPEVHGDAMTYLCSIAPASWWIANYPVDLPENLDWQGSGLVIGPPLLAAR